MAQQHRSPEPRNDKPEPKNLHSVEVRSQGEGKKFFFDLRENDRGIFLRIKEVASNGKVNFIIIPADALDEASCAMDECFNNLP